MKNNSCKLAKWTVQSVLAGADLMKIGCIDHNLMFLFVFSHIILVFFLCYQPFPFDVYTHTILNSYISP